MVEILLQRQREALDEGRPYPANLRIETFADKKRELWNGVSREVRRELREVIKEK